jgi:HK97 family phage portal protein
VTTTFEAVKGIFNRTPVRYVSDAVSRTGGLFNRNANMEGQMAAMGEVGTLFSIVNRTSTSLASVCWHMYRKPRPGQEKAECVEVTDHLALKLWNNPNQFYDGTEFRETVQQHVDLTGEGWWVVAKAPGVSIPLELWPVRPDRMLPVPSSTDFLAGYIYLGPQGERVPLALDQVIQIRMPNPLDPYRGMGPVQAILADLESIRYSAEWSRNFFINGAEPGGIIEFEQGLSDEEFKQMQIRWQEQHRGVSNAHRVAILERGHWVDRKYSMRDMQFTELRTASRDVIREAFGIPKFALGDVDDVNRATAEASAVWFGQQTTIPRLERFKAALNGPYLKMFGTTGQGVYFDYDSPVPLDREADNRELESKANSFKALREAGVIAEDAASVCGLPPLRTEQPLGVSA